MAIQSTLVPTPPYCFPGCVLVLDPWLGSCVLDSRLPILIFPKRTQPQPLPRRPGLSILPYSLFPSGASKLPTLRSFSLLGGNTNQILTNTLEPLLPLRLLPARTQGLTCFPPSVGYFQISLASNMPSFQTNYPSTSTPPAPPHSLGIH